MSEVSWTLTDSTVAYSKSAI